MMRDLSKKELKQEILTIAANYDLVIAVISEGSLKRVEREYLNILDTKNLILWSDFLPMPDIKNLDQSIKKFNDFDRSKKILIIAIGGGSCIDTAKVLSIMLPNKINLSQIINKLNKSLLDEKAYDILAIPTTAGSGSECTSFATIWDKDQGIKRSLDLLELKPKYVLNSSELLKTLSSEQLIISALDARAHAIESFWSPKSSFESEAFASLSLTSSIGIFSKITDKDADYHSLMKASFNAGKAINITRTSLPHAISYPLSIQFGVPHGLAVSFTLRSVWLNYRDKLNLEHKAFDLIEEATRELNQIDLLDYVLKYASKERILRTIPMIKKNSRVKNFKIQITDSDIKKILMHSLISQNLY